MKKLFLTAVAFAALIAGPAMAADLRPPVHRRPVVAVYNWTGFYLGASAGYGWTDGDNIVLSSIGTPVFSPSITTAAANAIPPGLNTQPKGFIYGGQVGYNYQWHQWVFGVEADLSGANINGSATQSGSAPVVNRTESKIFVDSA